MKFAFVILFFFSSQSQALIWPTDTQYIVSPPSECSAPSDDTPHENSARVISQFRYLRCDGYTDSKGILNYILTYATDGESITLIARQNEKFIRPSDYHASVSRVLAACSTIQNYILDSSIPLESSHCAGFPLPN